MTNPPDPHMIRIKLAERRTASAFKVFSDLTNGPGWRARVVEYGTIMLGAAFGSLSVRTLADALEAFLPTWAALVISVPFLLLGFVVALTALLPYLAAISFGFGVGKQWIAPVALLLLAAGVGVMGEVIGPVWSLVGYWFVMITAMYVSTLWAAPAIGRDIELRYALEDWARPQNEDDMD